MAYTTFVGRDGQQATFSWVTQKIGGVDAAVMVLDVAGAPVSSSNPLPVSAPSNLPVAVQGTVPVSVAAAISTITPADTATVSVGGTTIGTTSSQIIGANGTRKRIDVSNGSTANGIWIRPGATAATVGVGWYLPPQAQATYYTTLALQAISSASGNTVGFVEW